MNRQMKVGMVAVAMFTAMAACTNTGGGASGGGGGGGGGGSDPQSFCSSLCGRIHTCDNTSDQQTCTDSCVNADAAILPKIRSDVVSATESCFQSKDCATVLNSNVVSACIQEAAASIAPSA